MYAVLITYDQAHHDAIITILDRLNCRGYTAWPEVTGRGTFTGAPHLGSHAWPTLNSAICTVVRDDAVDPLLQRLQQLDNEKPLLGVHAYAWPVAKSI